MLNDEILNLLIRITQNMHGRVLLVASSKLRKIKVLFNLLHKLSPTDFANVCKLV